VRRLAFVHSMTALWEAEQRIRQVEARLFDRDMERSAEARREREVSRLRAALADAEAAAKAKGRLMSAMCHEVRTPLNGCLASAEMLLGTPLQVQPDG
jgi:signal transduction histidine kinase